MVGDGEGDVGSPGEIGQKFLFNGAEVQEAVEPDARGLRACSCRTDPVAAKLEAALADGVPCRAPQAFEGPGVRAEASYGGEFVGSCARVFEKVDGVEDDVCHPVGGGDGGELGAGLTAPQRIPHDGAEQAVRDEQRFARSFAQKAIQRNHGARGEDDAVTGELVLEVPDQRRRGDNKPDVDISGTQGLFKFAEDLPGLAAAGPASNEFHGNWMANKRRMCRRL